MATTNFTSRIKLPPEYVVSYHHMEGEYRIQLFDYTMALNIHRDDEVEYAVREAVAAIDRAIVRDYHAGKLCSRHGPTNNGVISNRHSGVSAPPLRGYTATSVYIDEAAKFGIDAQWIASPWTDGKNRRIPKKKDTIKELIDTDNPNAITFDF